MAILNISYFNLVDEVVKSAFLLSNYFHGLALCYCQKNKKPTDKFMTIDLLCPNPSTVNIIITSG